MSVETIVAVFDTAAHAAAAVQDLEQAGVPSGAITRHSKAAAGSSTTGAVPVREQGFWASLFGGEAEHGSDTAVYDRSLESGSTVVSVKAPEQSLTQVLDILERHNPVDVDDRAATYASTPTGAAVAPTPAAAAGFAPTPSVLPDKATGGTLQLTEESISVGKRVLNRGTTRVRRYVIETPVEEQVSLHSERVVVERHPVDGRVAGTPDFSDKVLEATETDEQAVVGKTVRVVEEVAVRKEASDRTETVRDTVRRQDVEITEEPALQTTTGTTASPVKPAI